MTGAVCADFMKSEKDGIGLPQESDFHSPPAPGNRRTGGAAVLLPTPSVVNPSLDDDEKTAGSSPLSNNLTVEENTDAILKKFITPGPADTRMTRPQNVAEDVLPLPRHEEEPIADEPNDSVGLLSANEQAERTRAKQRQREYTAVQGDTESISGLTLFTPRARQAVTPNTPYSTDDFDAGRARTGRFYILTAAACIAGIAVCLLLVRRKRPVHRRERTARRYAAMKPMRAGNPANLLPEGQERPGSRRRRRRTKRITGSVRPLSS